MPISRGSIKTERTCFTFSTRGHFGKQVGDFVRTCIISPRFRFLFLLVWVPYRCWVCVAIRRLFRFFSFRFFSWCPPPAAVKSEQGRNGKPVRCTAQSRRCLATAEIAVISPFNLFPRLMYANGLLSCLRAAYMKSEEIVSRVSEQKTLSENAVHYA